MFSGQIAHLGVVAASDGDEQRGMRLRIEAPEAIAQGVARGDSIAIDGVCLTVVDFDTRGFAFDLVPESIARTGFGRLVPGDTVNVELSLRLGDRLGGHLVYGHVDANAAIIEKTPEGQGFRLTVARPPSIAAMIVEKGYITVDGVSLTVASAVAEQFTIALIPETARRTTLGRKGAGATVNLEADPIARYALGALDAYAATGRASREEIAWAYEI